VGVGGREYIGKRSQVLLTVSKSKYSRETESKKKNTRSRERSAKL